MHDRSPWRIFLINRFTLTFATIALIVMLWNGYVERHNDGWLSGQVINQNGQPVSAAEVILSEQTIVSLAPLMSTLTDQQGRFQFRQHDRHHVVLSASKTGLGHSQRYPVRLYFRNQNRQLKTPLRLQVDD